MAAGDVTVNIESLNSSKPTGKGIVWFPVAGTDALTRVDDDDFSIFNGSADRAFSVSFWFLANDLSSGAFAALISKGEFAVDGEWSIGLDGGNKISWFIFGDAVPNSRIARSFTTVLTKNTWYHVVCTYDGSAASTGIDIYLDGVVVDNASNDDGVFTGSFNDTNTLRIGDRAGATPGQEGGLADIRFYHKDLSAAEALKIYNGTFADTEGLFAHYKFGSDLLTDATGNHDLSNATDAHLAAGASETIAQRMVTNRTSAADTYLLTTLAGNQVLDIFIDEA